MSNEVTCSFEPDKRTWFERLRDRLFPARHCFLPEPLSEWEMKGRLRIETIVVLSFADKIRVLLTGVVVVQTGTITENRIGRTKTSSVSFVGTKNRDLRG